jgi:hypothetical protein
VRQNQHRTGVASMPPEVSAVSPVMRGSGSSNSGGSSSSFRRQHSGGSSKVLPPPSSLVTQSVPANVLELAKTGSSGGRWALIQLPRSIHFHRRLPSS